MIESPPAQVSIVIPIYNGLPFIFQTIESVRHQTFSDWELILCDNASRDATVAKLRPYLAEIADARIRLITHDEHLGMGPNWNRSLAYAKGQFVKLLPSDDILLPNCLENQVRILLDHSDVGFTSSGKEIIDSLGIKYLERRPLRQGQYNLAMLEGRIISAIVNLIGEPGGVLTRRDLLEACGPYNHNYRYFIDIEMYLRFLEKADLYIHEKPLYQFRTHPQSETSASRKASVREYIELLTIYDKKLNLSRRPFYTSYLERKAYLIAWLRSLVMKTRDWIIRDRTAPPQQIQTQKAPVEGT